MMRGLFCYPGRTAFRSACTIALLTGTATLISHPQSGFPQIAQDRLEICDPDLKRAPGSAPYGYGLRGDRCEGVYAREIAGATLLVASFTESYEDFRATNNGKLQLEWTSPAEESIRLRASSLRPQLFYRMDTVRPPGSGSYQWSTDVLAALELSRRDVGVVAKTQLNVGSAKREVYLPLRVASSGAAKRGSAYELVLWSDAELSEVYLTLTRLGADGQPVQNLITNRALGYGYYPAERGIQVRIPPLPKRDTYKITLSADVRENGSSSITFLFYG